MDAAEDAIGIARKNKPQLIVLYVIDFYKYPYLISSTILAPTFGMEKYMEEKRSRKVDGNYKRKIQPKHLRCWQQKFQNRDY
jgi:hypothetical protein